MYQGLSKVSNCQWMFVQTVSSELLKFLLPNLVLWCIILSQIVFQTDWFAVFKVKATVKDHIFKIWPNTSWTADTFELNLDRWHIIICWVVLWKDWIALLLSRSRWQGGFKIPVNVHLDSIFSTAEPIVTKLGMVMHHHEPECHARRLVCCLQVQGPLRAHINKYGCFYHIYWTAHLFATKFNWMVHHHKLECFV